MNRIPRRITAEKTIGGKRYHVYGHYGTKERAETVAHFLEDKEGYGGAKIIKVHYIPVSRGARQATKHGALGASGRRIYYSVYVPGELDRD
jgi:hypothetical protein